MPTRMLQLGQSKRAPREKKCTCLPKAGVSLETLGRANQSKSMCIQRVVDNQRIYPLRKIQPRFITSSSKKLLVSDGSDVVTTFQYFVSPVNVG